MPIIIVLVSIVVQLSCAPRKKVEEIRPAATTPAVGSQAQTTQPASTQPAATTPNSTATSGGTAPPTSNPPSAVGGNQPAVRGLLPPFDGLGALAGKRVIVSPGHGYYYHSTLGWITQRGPINGLTEDIHTNEIAMDFLIPLLERAGARVFSCRERSRQEEEAIVEDDPASASFQTRGTWNLSTMSGYDGGTYRYAQGTAASATWSFKPQRSGSFPVWVWFREGTNRTSAARYTIEHSAGVNHVSLDQTKDGQRWLHLGDFPVTAGDSIKLTLTHGGGIDVSIADAVRFGAGLGNAVRNGGTSQKPRWKEAARYWLPFVGAPASVYDLAGYPDRDDDISARGNYADWQGGDAFLSLHTNAGGAPNQGTGTETYIHDTSPSAGSAALRTNVHTEVMRAIRQLHDPQWADRGQRSANFGELRAVGSMPAILIELAFHDTAQPDAAFLARSDFRFNAARAMVRGILKTLNAQGRMAPLATDPPKARSLGGGRVELTWQAQGDPLDPQASASDYLVSTSANGQAFDAGLPTGSVPTATISGLAGGKTYSFRVIARNAGGESLPSEAVSISVP